MTAPSSDHPPDQPPDQPRYASPPCYAQDVPGIPAMPVSEVPAWRKAMRATLIEKRMATPVAVRKDGAKLVANLLDGLVKPGPGKVISLYWPFRAELDLRGWMASAQARGARIALPLVTAKARPLAFREWWPGCPMERGVWNIPNPAGTPEVTPDTVIAPLVGFDPGCFRLGYGGGFFDRTLASLSSRPLVIGVGMPDCALPSIHPQPHDIPMDVIALGDGRVYSRRSG